MHKSTKCHTCDKRFNFMGISKHRSMHRSKMEDCVITFTNGETFKYSYRKKADDDMVYE